MEQGHRWSQEQEHRLALGPAAPRRLGVPQPWPAAVRPAFREPALRQQLAEAWAGVAEVREVSCEEYPCLVKLRLLTGDDSCCVQLDSLLPQALQLRMGESYVYGFEELGMNAILAFGDPAHWSAEIEKRTDWRVDDAGDLPADELREESDRTKP